MKSNNIIEVTMVAETCCDECNDVIHIHFYECPICNTNYADTDQYSDFEFDDTFECSICRSKFRFIEMTFTNNITKYKLEILKINKKDDMLEKTSLDTISEIVAESVDSVIMHHLLNPNESYELPKTGIPSQPITVTYTKTISICYHECPYFGLEGGPSPSMYCNHPDLKNIDYGGYIIQHPECDNGFPDKCPLFKNS